MLNININNESVVVSSRLIEEVFPQANPTFIKVYMYALMLCSKGKSVDVSKISDKLQLLESDVIQAFKFWSSYGVVDFEEAQDEKKNETIDTPVDISQEDISVPSNVVLTEMLQYAQEVLGKTISPPEMKTLYWMYDELKFSPEIILMLLEYCASIGKKNMQYIERVAASWHNKGITTIEQVDEFLADEEYIKNYMNRLKYIFGIRDRALTGIEEEYISKWHTEMGMTEEMIALAYEYCILRINKLSFPYIDKIISDWHSKNINTIEAAEAENELHKNKTAPKTATYTNDFNNDDLEKFTWGQTPNDEN